MTRALDFLVPEFVRTRIAHVRTKCPDLAPPARLFTRTLTTKERVFRALFVAFVCMCLACESAHPTAGTHIKSSTGDCAECHEALDTPLWSIPIHVSDDVIIRSFGVDDSDTIQRTLILRMVKLDAQWGVGVPVSAQTFAVDPGFQTTSVSTSYRPSRHAHFIQAFYRDIPAVNNGRLHVGFYTTASGITHVFPASSGHGYGTKPDLSNPYVDWIEPF